MSSRTSFGISFKAEYQFNYGDPHESGHLAGGSGAGMTKNRTIKFVILNFVISKFFRRLLIIIAPGLWSGVFCLVEIIAYISYSSLTHPLVSSLMHTCQAGAARREGGDCKIFTIKNITGVGQVWCYKINYFIYQMNSPPSPPLPSR